METTITVIFYLIISVVIGKLCYMYECWAYKQDGYTSAQTLGGQS